MQPGSMSHSALHRTSLFACVFRHKCPVENSAMTILGGIGEGIFACAISIRLSKILGQEL